MELSKQIRRSQIGTRILDLSWFWSKKYPEPDVFVLQINRSEPIIFWVVGTTTKIQNLLSSRWVIFTWSHLVEAGDIFWKQVIWENVRNEQMSSSASFWGTKIQNPSSSRWVISIWNSLKEPNRLWELNGTARIIFFKLPVRSGHSWTR